MSLLLTESWRFLQEMAVETRARTNFNPFSFCLDPILSEEGQIPDESMTGLEGVSIPSMPSQRDVEIIPDDTDDEIILISDDEEERNGGNVKTILKPLFSARASPLGFIPHGIGGRKSERNLTRAKRYGPSWLVRPQHFRRQGHDVTKLLHFEVGFRGCWLEDHSHPTPSAALQRRRDIDALPRWFGPLTYTTIFYNHERTPQNSLEFFQLAFQPVAPGDMEVWIKYRELEEEIWVGAWDLHRTKEFRSIIGDLHCIAFGQKEDAAKRVKQMDKAMTQVRDDMKVVPWVDRDYFMFAAADQKGLNE